MSNRAALSTGIECCVQCVPETGAERAGQKAWHDCVRGQSRWRLPKYLFAPAALEKETAVNEKKVLNRHPYSQIQIFYRMIS